MKDNDYIELLIKIPQFIYKQILKRHVSKSTIATILNNGTILQPKTGRWIDDKCSICGKGTEDLISSPEWYKNEEPNFCPFCGIKIESEAK